MVRVHIGQVIVSIHTKMQNKEHVIEALCRAKIKFPGRQKIHISKKWGFTKFNVEEFEDIVAEKQLIPYGSRSKTSLIMVPWTNGGVCTCENLGTVPSLSMPTNKSYFLSRQTKRKMMVFLQCTQTGKTSQAGKPG